MPEWLKITIYGKNKFWIKDELNGEEHTIYDNASRQLAAHSLVESLLSWMYKNSDKSREEYIVCVDEQEECKKCDKKPWQFCDKDIPDWM